MYHSVATIDSPEFINLQPMEVNPFMSKCDIKVFYLGENRNGSSINKEVATEMSKTLRGAPIVGVYRKEKEDFGDHGKKITIDQDGIKFEKTTIPYGFVSPDAKVWFQNFQDIENGVSVIRTYLMTTGYLWTGQFPECQAVIEEGKGQSMEIDEDTLKGVWSKSDNDGLDFFIINDAIFSKLCILGDDVEPCFEGASITAPQVSSSFSKEDKFVHTLFSMMQELKEAINTVEGGKEMVKTEQTSTSQNEEVVKSFEKTENSNSESTQAEVGATTEFKQDEEQKDVSNSSEEGAAEGATADFEKKDDKEDKKDEEPKDDKSEGGSEGDNKSEPKDDKSEGEDASDPKSAEDEDKKKKPATDNSLVDVPSKDYAELESKYNDLQAEFSKLSETCEALTKFKRDIEDKEKDELISSFYMLDDEDKKDVIANKSQYSLDDIEAKLSVICVRKKVDFSLTRDTDVEKTAPTTYNVNSQSGSDSEEPEWLKAVDAVKNSK